MTRRVDVWWADLDVPVEKVPGLAARLSAAEQERAGRFLFEHLRRRFVVAHAMVRDLLALDVAASFDIGEHGKPSLPGGPHFNLSHSGERAVLAVCTDADVGVDVEARRPVGPGVAERIMSADERRAHQAAADPARFLLEVWTAKEAVVKATGDGIINELRSLSFAGHTLVRLDLGPDYLAALAVAGREPVDVDVKRWTPPVG